MSNLLLALVDLVQESEEDLLGQDLQAQWMQKGWLQGWGEVQGVNCEVRRSGMYLS